MWEGKKMETCSPAGLMPLLLRQTPCWKDSYWARVLGGPASHPSQVLSPSGWALAGVPGRRGRIPVHMEGLHNQSQKGRHTQI